MKIIRVFISGIVQGVFFRAFIKEEADKLNLKGYVRNLEAGRVEAIFEGYDNDVNRMIEICKKGSKYSKVTDIEIEKIENQGLRNLRF